MAEVSQVVNQEKTKSHKWRRCPKGMYFVKTHLVHIPPSKKHPDGLAITRHAHCAKNPTRKSKQTGEVTIKDFLSFDEISYITDKYFLNLSGFPKVKSLSKFRKSTQFDRYIAGWVFYWNDIFRLHDPLDPNLVKALIATESSFEIDPGITKARGLMQVQPITFSILRDPNGELNRINKEA